ncbi:hypothetical protein Celaphus_00018128 [Cervus elaphus hippelaphus]|uniref:PLAC domain-containing protein n=1 Tax=Cervus elaphus hippelaphus TaxID=46360 RepID=A0A212C890_CEREH|nr:hypothetical protein Celaphus_00018128 [Cervus elaphus hippelaphus]
MRVIAPLWGDWLVKLFRCTATCGGGVQTRSVQCLAGGRPAVGCSVLQKPAVSQACNTHFCAIAEKKGTYQERSCKNSTTRVVRVTCSAALPAEQLQGDGRLALISRGFRGWRLVTDAGCWLSGASCGDRFRWCALVPRPGVCGHHFYGRQCCKTCAASNL